MAAKRNTKQIIISESFKLFARYNYEDVSYTKIEEATGLTRWVIRYHYKQKIDIFREIIRSIILGGSSIESVIKEEESLKKNLNNILKYFKEEKVSFSKMGIENPNKAMLRIEVSALTEMEDGVELFTAWRDKQLSCWYKVLNMAKEKGEIAPESDVDTLAELFLNLYLGTSLSGVLLKKGYNDVALNRSIMTLYEFCRVK